MLVQLLAALVGDAIFGEITSKNRRFQTDMLRYLETRGFVAPDETAPPHTP